jgi:hypothetical protein
VIVHRGGTCGTHPVNVPRGHSRFTHLRRAFTQYRSTCSPARRTSRGQASTLSCTFEDNVPQSGHAAAPGQSVTVQTSTAPPGPACTSVTCRPSTPSSADAVS